MGGREGRVEGEIEMGDVEGGKGKGREREREEGSAWYCYCIVATGGVKTICVQANKATPAKATTSCQTGSPDTMPTGYWSKQSTCQYRPLLGY